jgi:ppGpp synthetase/RelA/SpoT-type nucleotidyltranferase
MARKEGTELIIRCREVADFTEKAAMDDDLLRALTEVGGRVPIYAFKNRFKGPRNILKKVERKRAEGLSALSALEPLIVQERLVSRKKKKPTDALTKLETKKKDAIKLRDYNPDHITDALGCRFVTLYQTEIPTIVGSLLSGLHGFNQKAQGREVRLREFVIYTNRPTRDPLSIVNSTIDVLKRSNFAGTTSTIRRPEHRKSAYSSVHLVFDRDVEIEHAGRPRTTELATFEVQVRDIFEEGWGEVQHHLLYSEKDESGGRKDHHEDEGEQWRLHLNALKTFVDGCSQHASIIRMHFDSAKRSQTTENAIRSVTEREKDRTNVIQTLKRLDGPESAIEEISDGYVIFESAEQSSSNQQKITRYNEAARKFHQARLQLSRRVQEEPVPTGHGRTVEYYLVMEEGNCKVAAAEAVAASARPDETLEKQLLEEARFLFSLMIAKFPEDPVAHGRAAKTLEKFPEDIEALREALRLYRRAAELVRGDAVTGPEHWLAILSHVNVGYVLWLLSLLSEDEAQVTEMLREAAQESLTALDVWRKQPVASRTCEINKLHAHKAASNVLYFCGKLLGGGLTDEIVNAETISQHIDLIRDLNITVYADYYKTKDNLIFAYLALGDGQRVKSLAQENFRELRDLAEKRSGTPLDIDAILEHLRGAEQRCFKTARDVLFSRLDGETDGR